MSRVLVLSPHRIPLAPCTPARARWLLSQKKAAVVRRFPFTLGLVQEPSRTRVPPLRLKIDPASTTPGLAMVDDATGQVIWAGELTHRGQPVREGLHRRRAWRRSRRQRHTRYRARRVDNRRRRDGWLPPALESRLANGLTWLTRLGRCGPVGAISRELVKVDPQLLHNPEITGGASQPGELAGYELRPSLLAKFGHRCAYGGTTPVPLEGEPIIPRSRGGSDRVSNLTIACHSWNQAKDNPTAAELGHPQVQAQARAPLRDAAALNAPRWALYHRLQATPLPIETGSGGRTTYHRTRRGLPKTPWLDAAGVGASTPGVLHTTGIVPLLSAAQGRHSRQMCRTNRFGFPDTAPKATSGVGGFRTGDLVRAVVPPSSSKAGTYVGRMAIRATGSCNLTTAGGTIEGIHVRHCLPLQRGDGYR
jgi:hypothetical protein